jgi:hypothetical protein
LEDKLVTTGIAADNTMKVDVPERDINERHWLLQAFDLDTDKLVQVTTGIEPAAPPNNSRRKYQIVGDMPLNELVRHHYPAYQNGGVSFIFNAETGGILDCLPLGTGQSKTAGASAA